MKKLIGLLSVFCLLNICYGSGCSPEVDFSVNLKTEELSAVTMASNLKDFKK